MRSKDGALLWSLRWRELAFCRLGLAVSREWVVAAFFFPVLAFSFLFMLLLVYIVRVRQPAAEVPPAPLSEQR